MQLYTKDLYPSREQRRNAVRFAKEVLILLEKNKIKATKGCYISLYSNNPPPKLKTFSLQKLLKSNNSTDLTCKVCAVGALFLGKAAIENEVDIDISPFGLVTLKKDGPEVVRNTLGRLNSQIIEAAFECGDRFVSTYYFKNEIIIPGSYLQTKLKYLAKAASKTYEYCKDLEERLAKICKNIIENKGIFLPVDYKLEVPIKN